MRECPEWLRPLPDAVKVEYNDIWQEYYEKLYDLRRGIEDDLNALYLEHHPEGDK